LVGVGLNFMKIYCDFSVLIAGYKRGWHCEVLFWLIRIKLKRRI